MIFKLSYPLTRGRPEYEYTMFKRKAANPQRAGGATAATCYPVFSVSVIEWIWPIPYVLKMVPTTKYAEFDHAAITTDTAA